MKRLLLLSGLLAVAGVLVLRQGGRRALALPQDVRIVSVSCAANPEVTVIQNTGLLPISLNGFAINDLATGGAAGGASNSSSVFYPLPPGLSLNPGQIATFFSGPAAPAVSNNLYTLTRLYIYNHALARSKTEGAVLSFDAQAVSTALCAEAATPIPVTPTPTSAGAPLSSNTPVAAVTPAPTAAASPSTTTPTAAASASATPEAMPSTTALPTPTPPAESVAAASAIPTVVGYTPGWNLVGGPGGTVFASAEELLAPSPDGSGYVTVDPQQPVAAGFGYWAYFPTSDPNPQVSLAPSALQTLTLSIEPGVWSLVANPTQGRVTVAGADAVDTYNPVDGYEAVADLGPGQGALVFSYSNSQVTLTAEAMQPPSAATAVPALPAQQAIPTAEPPQSP